MEKNHEGEQRALSSVALIHGQRTMKGLGVGKIQLPSLSSRNTCLLTDKVFVGSISHFLSSVASVGKELPVDHSYVLLPFPSSAGPLPGPCTGVLPFSWWYAESSAHVYSWNLLSILAVRSPCNVSGWHSHISF